LRIAPAASTSGSCVAKPRAIAPAEWNGLFYARGLFGPMFDKRADQDQALAQIITEAEARQRDQGRA